MGKIVGKEGGKVGRQVGGRGLRTQLLLAGEGGSSMPPGAALPQAGSLRARLPGQRPRAGKMRGLSGQAWGGQSPRFILLILQTFVELWPSYLDVLGGWISPGPGSSPHCVLGGESWGQCMASSLGGLWRRRAGRVGTGSRGGERKREESSVVIQERLSGGEAKCGPNQEGQVDLEGVY